MTERATRKCANPQCFLFGEWVGGYCPAHAKRQGDHRKQSRHGLETYDPAWKKFVLSLRGQGNVVCQSVNEFGVRCNRPTWGFHHILEVSARPDVGLNPENVVGVCLACHNWIEKHQAQQLFVPTLWRPPMSTEPLADWLVAPGAKVTHEQRPLLWTLSNRQARFAR